MFNKTDYIKFFKEESSYRKIYEWMISNGNDQVAMEYVKNNEWKQLTYNEYHEYVMGTAENIQECIPSDNFIGIQVENSPYFAIIFWASLMAGKNIILLDAKLPENKVLAMLKKAGATDVIVTKKMKNANYHMASQLVKRSATCSANWANKVALCTSGTTSTSKIFVHSGKQMTEQLLCLEKLIEKNDRWGRFDRVEKSLAFLPLHHVFGFVAVFLLTSVTGNTLVFPEKISPEILLQTCRERNITQLVAVPIFWNTLTKMIQRKIRLQGEKQYNEFRKLIALSIQCQKNNTPLPATAENILNIVKQKTLGDHLYLGCTGGGYILPETLEIINGLGYYLVNGYGITETGIISVTNSEDITERLSGSIGTPLSAVTVKIDAKEDTQSGEILVQAPFIHNGMIENGIIIPKDYSGETYFSTGDIGHFTSNNIFIDGRIKDIILDGSGENIYPDEVQSYFESLHGIDNLVVLGIKKELYEEVALVVQCQSNCSKEQLKKEVLSINATLPMGMQVKALYLSLHPLPLSSSMKVRRQWLKNEIENNRWECETIDLFENTSSVSIDMVTTNKQQSLDKPLSSEYLTNTICQMVSRVLVLPDEQVNPDSNFISELHIDSLESLSILTEIEATFGITINKEEYYRCLTPASLANLVYQMLCGSVSEKKTIRREKAEKIISKFEDSREFQDFMNRQSLLEQNVKTYGNPFFVEHDSPLMDTSLMDGKKVVNFGSYNYLCFSGDEAVNKAAIEAIKKYGTSASGSRLLAGEKPLHRQLEQKIAHWKNTEDALVLVGGHSTNVTFVGNFCNERDFILYDALSHNSVEQGIKLSCSETRAFPHNDVQALEKILQRVRSNYEKVLIIVEGAYSMDGDIAPIPELVRLKKEYGCFLMVDEAHSACVIGENGKGVDEYFGLKPDDIDIKMGTLSKGLGACGGYLAGSHHLIEYLRYNIPGFVFSVGISPALAGAVIKSLELMEESNGRVKMLHKNIDCFMEESKKHGFDTCLAGESAITPILIGSEDEAFTLSMLMQEDGIFVPPAVYPAVPKGKARLRYCLNSKHTKEQIVNALNILEKRWKEIKNKTV